MDIQLFIFDNDDTLVTKKREMLPHTKKVLQYLHDHGYMLGLASGRDVEQLKSYPRERWGLDFDLDMIIGANGGEVYDAHTGRMHVFNKMSGDTIREIDNMLKPLNVNTQFYFNGKMYLNRMDDLVAASIERNGYDNIVYLNDEVWESLKDLELFKIGYRGTEEATDRINAFMKAHPSDKFRGVRTQTTMFEVGDIHNNKGHGLEVYCQDTGMKYENIMAFGDIDNDNEMLALCQGVCMINGAPETKACAKFVTDYDNEHDGVARFIEDHVLHIKVE